MPSRSQSAHPRPLPRHFGVAVPMREARPGLVGEPGVEPGPLTGQDPKSCASANSATRPSYAILACYVYTTRRTPCTCNVLVTLISMKQTMRRYQKRAKQPSVAYPFASGATSDKSIVSIVERSAGNKPLTRPRLDATPSARWPGRTARRWSWRWLGW